MRGIPIRGYFLMPRWQRKKMSTTIAITHKPYRSTLKDHEKKVNAAIDIAYKINACRDDVTMAALVEEFVDAYINITDGSDYDRYPFDGYEYQPWQFVSTVIDIAIAGRVLCVEAVLRKCMDKSNRHLRCVKCCMRSSYDNMMAYFIDNDRMDLFALWAPHRPIWGGYNGTIRAVCRHHDVERVGAIARSFEKHELLQMRYSCIIGDKSAMMAGNCIGGTFLVDAAMAGNLDGCQYIRGSMRLSSKLIMLEDVMKEYPYDKRHINPRYCHVDCLRLICTGKEAEAYTRGDQQLAKTFANVIVAVIHTRRRDLINEYMTKTTTAWMMGRIGSMDQLVTHFVIAYAFIHSVANISVDIALSSRYREVIECVLESDRDCMITHGILRSLTDRGFIRRSDEMVVYEYDDISLGHLRRAIIEGSRRRQLPFIVATSTPMDIIIIAVAHE